MRKKLNKKLCMDDIYEICILPMVITVKKLIFIN